MRSYARVVVLGAVFAVLIMGCGGEGGSDGQPGAASTATTSGSPESAPAARAEPLVGEWQRTTTCDELVRALERAGLEKLAPQAVAGNGFVPGVTAPEQLAHPARPCEGAVPRKHSHFFTQDGQFGSRDWNGEQVDDGAYEVIDDRTFVISKEFPDVTFHYRIRGDAIMFDPVIPDGCATFRCLWSVSVAYPGKTWERVS